MTTCERFRDCGCQKRKIPPEGALLMSEQISVRYNGLPLQNHIDLGKNNTFDNWGFS